eukprot:gene34411-44454_t
MEIETGAATHTNTANNTTDQEVVDVCCTATYVEHIFIGPFIRLYTNVPLLASLGNAVSIVNLVGQSAATTKINISELFNSNYGGQDDSNYQCHDGEQNIGRGDFFFICPYQTSNQFRIFIILVCCYYGLLIIAKILYLLQFGTHDLRYYLACDCFNSTRLNKGLHFIGVLLVLACGGYGIFVLQLSGNTSGIGTVLFFMIFNSFALYAGTKTHYKALQGITFDDEIFKHTIPHIGVSEGPSIIQKVTRSHYDLIDALIRDAFITLNTHKALDEKVKIVFEKIITGKKLSKPKASDGKVHPLMIDGTGS